MINLSQVSWEKLQQEVRVDFEAVKNAEQLDAWFAKFLGKKGALNQMLKSLKELSSEDKQHWGPILQEQRQAWQQQHQTAQAKLSAQALAATLEDDWLDTTKSIPLDRGSLHPLVQVQQQVENIFTSMGFLIADGPEVETEWNNFDALNIPPSHPARDMQDTFWVADGKKDTRENYVLRTHTSGVQIRSMLQHGAPLRIIAPGRVYRNEEVDQTHDATFYQVEGLMIDEDITLGHLKGTIQTMLDELFKKEIKIRFRPGYFPFVEPGLEIDIWFEYQDKEGRPQAKWMEFMGGGMIHPNVLESGKIDSKKYQGFAFGFGLTRLVMLKYGIEDIRHLFSNKPEFLQQF